MLIADPPRHLTTCHLVRGKGITINRTRETCGGKGETSLRGRKTTDSPGEAGLEPGPGSQEEGMQASATVPSAAKGPTSIAPIPGPTGGTLASTSQGRLAPPPLPPCPPGIPAPCPAPGPWFWASLLSCPNSPEILHRRILTPWGRGNTHTHTHTHTHTQFVCFTRQVDQVLLSLGESNELDMQMVPAKW